MRFIVTNDDGPFSPGLWILAEVARSFGEVFVVVPETPKSATGLGLTLHKPVRVNKLNLSGELAYLVSGTPSDVIYIAMNVVVGRPDLVLSGVNVGDNLSIQVMLTSGTLGAVLQAAIEGVPGVAFSAAVREPGELEEPGYRRFVSEVVRAVLGAITQLGFPRGIDVLNVNIPPVISSEVVVVPPARRRFSAAVVKRVDPQGRPYYWLYGQPVEAEKGTDVRAVLEEGKVAITPLALSSLFTTGDEAFSAFIESIAKRLQREAA
ncbi:MAG: 5'/3'-nucleotidase SurE [Thermofilum sp.]